jgi:transcriptional regulator with XRE-family HTH domain
MDAARTLGQVIRSRRLALGMTQEELAERIGDGVRQAEVSRLECDRVSLPRRRRLMRIAEALQIPLGELLASAGWAGADTVFRAQEDTAVAPAPVVGAATDAATPREPLGQSDYTSLQAVIARSHEIRQQTLRLIEDSRALTAGFNAGTGRRNSAWRPER